MYGQLGFTALIYVAAAYQTNELTYLHTTNSIYNIHSYCIVMINFE